MQINTILKKGDEVFENTVLAEFKDKTYTYLENGLNVSIEINENVIIKRENDDYKMKLVFINSTKTHNEMFLKEDNISLDIEIYTEEITIKDNYLEIKYQMNEEKCVFTLEGVK